MTRHRLAPAILALGCLALTGCGGGSAKQAAATSSPTFTDFVATAPPTTPTTAVPSTLAPYSPPPSTTTVAPAPTASAPRELSCADVGGVFVAHGTDGRGDCESADPRAACHIAPAQQPDNYLAELTMTPPFPGGSIDYPFMIAMASNADCWKQPPGQ